MRVRIRVQPRASRTELVGEHGDVLRIRVAAPPVDGEANHELLRFLSRRLKIPIAQLHVVAGATGRNKVIEIAGVSAETIIDSLASP